MKKKKITLNFPWDEKKLNIKKCDQINCNNQGDYKAPKSINSNEVYNFCLEHVKIYNKRWNFFAGKSQKQIYQFLKEETYINKPTRPMSERISSKINFDFSFDADFNSFFEKKPKKETMSSKLTEIDKALNLFNLSIPFTSLELKKIYNNLVKRNHPDLHDGNKKKETLLKKINIYYKLLKKVAR
ncbi:MAG: hypothetical protein CBE14_002235 [Rickettsiales bacterium TMED254]|nr:hypothetical protein [Rickettsiales bacterium]RPF76550.1 MAG: hypothetical protein CBE14_002235 [Rickettsiales bacterium TMED254]|tara:strand:- start:951 stop:1505 length:555 start_codon:yes stop_codon:yes gene_type:complete